MHEIVQSPTYTTDHLYVLYDTGEACLFLAIMEELVKKDVAFQFIAEGSSINSLVKENFENEALFQQTLAHRIDLKEIGVTQNIPVEGWERDQGLLHENIEKIVEHVKPIFVHVGTASRFQIQVLKKYKKLSPDTIRLAYPDNFDCSQALPLLHRIQKRAEFILCPSKYTAESLEKNQPLSLSHPIYKVIGKPTIDKWEKKGQNKALETLAKLNLNHSTGPIVAFIGGYDNEDETTHATIIHPLFEQCMIYLQKAGYRTVFQPHPKTVSKCLVQTCDLLPIVDVVVGYRSTVLFDACALGKKCIYMIPELGDGKTFHHFSIEKGYIPAIYIPQERPKAYFDQAQQHLLDWIKDERNHSKVKRVFEEVGIPENSISCILKIYEQIRSGCNQR